MVDISNLIDIEKIRENKDQLREQRIKNAQLSGWEEMSKYISSMEESLACMTCNNAQDTEYFNGQAEAIEMFKSFIASRVELIAPEHPIARTNDIAATM